MPEKDYYSILNIGENAGTTEMKAAYRKLALQYHPDRNTNNPAANAKMMELNEAYAILSDPLKRQEYDRLRVQDSQSASERYRQTHTTEDIFRGSDIKQVYVDLAKQFGLSDFDKVFRATYGSKYRSFEFRNNGVHGRAFVFYDTQKSNNNNTNVRGINSAKPPVADSALNSVVKKMSVDNGTPKKGKDRRNKITLNPKLAREGGEIELRINQQGAVRNLKINIPAGIKEGQNIRLKELGEPGKGGGQPGDLFLEVRFKISPLHRLRNLFNI